MMARKALSFLFTAWLLPALASCTSFAPVYGERGGLSPADFKFNFAEPDSRIEQVVLNQLALSFVSPPTPLSPTLDVTVSSSNLASAMSNAQSFSQIIQTRVTATVTITQGEDVVTITRFSDASYRAGSLTPTDLASATAATETAARSTAEALRAAILATYKPAMQ